jgi:hypothetical protein
MLPGRSATFDNPLNTNTHNNLQALSSMSRRRTAVRMPYSSFTEEALRCVWKSGQAVDGLQAPQHSSHKYAACPTFVGRLALGQSVKKNSSRRLVFLYHFHALSNLDAVYLARAGANQRQEPCSGAVSR